MNEFGKLNPEELLSLCIAGEARGEDVKGMMAVGCVVRNRLEGSGFGKTWQEVILRPAQFSCFNQSDPNRAFLLKFDFESRSGRFFRWIARGIISGMIPDLTGGATHYHSKRIPKPRGWDGLEPVAEIGNHIFYK